MTLILPFTIGDLSFVHTEGNESLDTETRDVWRGLCQESALFWTNRQWQPCDCPGETIVFSVTQDGSPRPFPWAMYGVLPIAGDTSVVRAIPAPMSPGIGKSVRPREEEGTGPGVKSSSFWRSTFKIMEFLLDTPLVRETGRPLELDHWYFPSVFEGHPRQHEWVKVERFFQEFASESCDHEVSGGRITKMCKNTRT